MTDAEKLEAVKIRMGLTGDYFNPAISGHIFDTECFMKRAGVSDKTLNSDESIGAIARGTSDLWNYGSGDGQFSVIFLQMVGQLRY